MERYTYPPAPPGQITIGVTASFKKQAIKVTAAIALFFLVYVALVIAVFALAFVAVFYGIVLVISFPRWITLLLGAGMIATGVSLVFFLVKFIGSVVRDRDTGRWQLSEADHPVLFGFLRKVATETQTPFPKKVFISPEVNAAVFYDSSFLSMFLPVKKNLVLGLGLLNAVNLSECKAIIAHEFGHFSQRSMKAGSYTYNVNLIIYNMLYENTSYHNFLQRWGSLGLLSVFAVITVKISTFIQWILRGMYSLINKEYMALSREMEFHADAIAASVAGGNNLLTALARVKMADPCYQKVIQDANELVADNKRIDNIFHSQSYIYRLVAEQFRLPLNEGLPEVSYAFAAAAESSRINIKNQWASHPTLTEREQNVDALNVNIEPVAASPWLLFDDPVQIQQMVTKRLYEPVQFERPPDLVNTEEYEQWINLRRESRRLPPEYKGFYDSRYVSLSKEELEQLESTTLKTFDEIFTEENGNLQHLIENHRQDLQMVRAIQENQIDIKSFDFDGNKISARNSGVVVDQLEADLRQTEEKQAQLDKEAFLFFYNHAEDPALLQQRYLSFLETKEFVSEYSTTSGEVIAIVQRIAQTVTLEQAAAEAQRLREIDTTVIKPALSRIFVGDILAKEANEAFYNRAADFLKSNYSYFLDNAFLEIEISGLFTLNTTISQILEHHLFATYKSLLEYQLRGSGSE